MQNAQPDTADRFDLLTEKQVAVLTRLAQGRTTKEIATSLGVSEPTVNRRIELLRSRFGSITRLELARRYREHVARTASSDGDWAACVDIDPQRLHLARHPDHREETARDELPDDLIFRDSIAMTIDPPWTRPPEPQVVPRVLDGKNAMIARGAMIAILLFAILASLILGLAAAQALTDAIGGSPP